jgi:hypothetical protein
MSMGMTDEKPTAARRAVEAWAAAKGHAPTTTDAKGREQHNPASWQFAAAKANERWPLGAELTEAEYDAAIARAGAVTLNHPPKAQE